jgi:DNA topoisomerase VI subunit B
MSTESRAKRKRKTVSYAVPSSDDEDIVELSSSSASSSDESDSDYSDGASSSAKGGKKKTKKKKKKKATRKKSSSTSTRKKQTGLQSKSPAEFFAENQNIAGFDNPGKALYTTIREFVENSLDAAEGIGRLPDISIEITEMGREGLDAIRGVDHRSRRDEALYAPDEAEKGKGKKKRKKDGTRFLASQDSSFPASQDSNFPASQDSNFPASQDSNFPASQESMHGATAAAAAVAPAKAVKKKRTARSEVSVYRITCKDNGTGMPHDQVPNMLGRVLSGSNYGLRQTRGKFGLGSKMALIWAKKSTGMPIEVKTAYCKEIDSFAPSVTYCKLDIDIMRNEPKVLMHYATPNNGRTRRLGQEEEEEEADASGSDVEMAEGSTPAPRPWVGTEISVIIEGNWLTYSKYIRKYFEELAVVTPYAALSLSYNDQRNINRSLALSYARRSDRIPPMAAEVKHHPKSVNNLIVRQLLDRPEARSMTIFKFLNSQFQCISKPLSKRLVAELGMDAKRRCKGLSDAEVHSITKLLQQAKIPEPSGSCLSPAGEYNLKLGIMKEFGLDSRYVATASSAKTGTFEGHPFMVECGLSFGGDKCKEGVTVHRFANRIPLLFEGGSDVASVVAKKKINWTQYKLKSKADKIGVFVSIVSTKIPFKGTGKEFISAQNGPYMKAIRTLILNCANQLRSQISKDRQSGADDQRKKNIQKYIPNVCSYIAGVLDTMVGADKEEEGEGSSGQKSRLLSAIAAASAAGGSGGGGSSSSSSSHPDFMAPNVVSMLKQVKSGKVSNLVLEDRLNEFIARMDDLEALERITSSKKNESISGSVFVPAVDYLAEDTFAPWQLNAGGKAIFRPLAGVAGEDFWSAVRRGGEEPPQKKE